MPRRLRKILAALAVLLVFGTIFFKFVENWNWVDAFYFTATSISALGYGDIRPLTDVGKIATAIFTFTTITLFLYAISGLASHHATKSSQE